MGSIVGVWDMTIEVVSIDEHEEGSATLQVNMDEETKDLLINIGFETLIRKALENETSSND
jgi:hypothetical protein